MTAIVAIVAILIIIGVGYLVYQKTGNKNTGGGINIEVPAGNNQ
jgi:hypothetical protein